MKKSILRDKSLDFALEIVRLAQELQWSQREFILSIQVLRSGTSIGALLREAEFAASHADYINKFTVALKEANETDYWIFLLHKGQYLKTDPFKTLHGACAELIAMLVTSIKTLKQNSSKTSKRN